MVQPCLIVRGQGDDQRALGAQFHIDTRDLEQLGGESGPTRLAFTAERDQGLLAGFGLGAGRQHASGGVARAATSRAPVEYLNRCSPRRQSPRNGKADHPGADDGDIRLSDIWRGLVRQPAAPFAGMTQTEMHLTSKRNGLRLQTTSSAHIGALSVSGTVANRGTGTPR